MSEYREHWNLAADPPAALVYSRLAELREEAERRRTVGAARPRVRPYLARALRRLAAAIEPAPSVCEPETA